MSTQETLAYEDQRRPRAALAAFGGPLLIVAGSVILALVLGDAPRSTVLGALERAAAPGAIGGTPSAQIPVLEHYADNAAALVAAGVTRGLGYLLLGLALSFLAVATRARVDGFSKLALYAPAAGGVLVGLSWIFQPLGTLLAVDSVLDGPRTVDAVTDGASSVVAAVAQILGLVGTAALAAAFLLVSLAAMRAGLLTRFMGILGMLCGVLTLLPLERIVPGALPFPLVQVFWLIGLGLLFLRRWPGGTPPAWQTGRAEPWPTQQELAEARQGGAPKRRPERPQPATVPAATPHPSSRKKKRKRRT